MQVANPIYDVVFKYLLDDQKVAKLLLSALLEQEVEELRTAPYEGREVSEDDAPMGRRNVPNEHGEVW